MSSSYYVVEFEEGGLAVVRSIWVTPRKKEVFWPPVKDTKQFQKILNSEEQVNETTWKLHPIQKIFFECDDLAKANEKLRKAELTSNLDTSEEENSQPIKRSRKVRRFSDSSSEEEHKQRTKRPPSINVNKFIKVQSSSSITHQSQNSPSQSFCSTPTTSVLQTPTPKVVQIDAVGYQSLMQNIIILQEQNKQIISLLEQKNSQQNLPGVPDFPVILPIQSTEDLLILENFLETNGDVVKSFLSRIGGDSVAIKTKRILKKMLTDNVASEFSFFGKRDKKVFSTLNLFNVIRDAVKENFVKATDCDVEKATKIWLKHAPQRQKKA